MSLLGALFGGFVVLDTLFMFPFDPRSRGFLFLSSCTLLHIILTLDNRV